MIDTTLLARTLSQNLEYNVRNVFASSGHQVPDIALLTSFLSELYKHHPPETINSTLEVIVSSDSVNLELGLAVHRSTFIERFSGDSRVMLISEDQCLVLSDDISNVLDDQHMIMYKFENRVEVIRANGVNIPIVNPESCSLSIFALPTFKDLDDALWRYYERRARYSVCPELRRVWLSPDRMRFLPGPEHTLRDSLWLFLRDVLRGDPEIKREQNVDDLNPVDIKVTWKWVKSVALIEIKWLGKSFNPDTRRRTKDFTQARAIDGAAQLRDYIETSRQEDSDLHFEGYLVVFDGRRQGIGESIDGELTKAQAFYFRDRHVEYPLELRQNIRLKLDYRFFLEPNFAS